MKLPAMYFAENERRPNWAKDPAVVHFNNRYYLYYTIAPSEERPGLGIGIAESQDLVNWHYIREMEIKTDVHPHGFGAPAALVREGKVYLFYQSYGTGVKDAICLAVSENGLDFTIDPGSPIFHPPVSSWSCGRAIDADIVFYKGKYFLYAATRDPENKVQKIVAAVSEGGFSAESWKLAYEGIILAPELPWEMTCIEAPATLIHNEKIYMFYAGACNNTPQQIGCAVSTDGGTFRRISNEPILPAGAPPESGTVSNPGILTPLPMTMAPSTFFIRGTMTMERPGIFPSKRSSGMEICPYWKRCKNLYAEYLSGSLPQSIFEYFAAFFFEKNRLSF